MDFTKVKNITVDGQAATMLTINGVTVWQAETDTTYTVTYNLTDCAVQGDAPTTATAGDRFAVRLRGVNLDSFTGGIKVTMGGVDITNSAVEYDGGSYDRYNITISVVTGDIVITCDWYNDTEEEYRRRASV